MSLMLALLAASAADRADVILRRSVPDDGPGAAVMVIRDGEPAWRACRGLADVDAAAPITPQTTFELASVSKHFTAYAVLLLADRNRLALDDDIRGVLPEMPERDPPIRILDLLHHVSGIRDYLELVPADASWMRNEDVLALLVDEPLEFVTGESWAYSNSNYCLLALIIERLSGRTYGEFMRAELFEPLGMSTAYVFEDASARVEGAARGYSDGDISESDLVMTGDGGVRVSLDDWIGWDREWRAPTLLAPETLARAFEPGGDHGYALGWAVGDDRGRRIAEHSGGWFGASTYTARWLDDGICVVALSNDEDLDAARLGRRIGRLFLP